MLASWNSEFTILGGLLNATELPAQYSEFMNTLEKLQKRVADSHAAWERDKELAKPTPNQLMSEDARDYIEKYDFWCDECRKDFTSSAYKVMYRLYGDYIAVYHAEHKCGEECVRYITHRDSDPYYYLSEKILSDRNRYAEEILQAEDYGFKTFYGEPYEEYYKKLKEREKDIILQDRDIGLKGPSWRTQEKLKRLRIE